jgi:hypothetical protein
VAEQNSETGYDDPGPGLHAEPHDSQSQPRLDYYHTMDKLRIELAKVLGRTLGPDFVLVGSEFDPDSQEVVQVNIPQIDDHTGMLVNQVAWKWARTEGGKLTCREIPISKIFATQPLLSHWLLEKYVHQVEVHGDQGLDPPLCLKVDDCYYLLDDHYSTCASKFAGYKTIVADILEPQPQREFVP